MLDWEDLRAFGVVLRTGSLSAAARALRVTQPTMRRRLDALEQTVGSALFTRSPSGLIPTETARDLGRHVESMATAAEAFARSASADVGDVEGVVRITASDVMGAEVLPAILAGLRSLYPGLNLELHLSNRTQDLLRQEADLAVRMVRPTQAAIVTRRVGTIGLGLFAHRDYLRHHNPPAVLDDLAGHALIGPDKESADLAIVRGSGLDLRRDMFTVRTDSQLAQLGAIRGGLGIGICQIPLGRRDPALVQLLPDSFYAGMETWVAMHEDLRRVRRIRVTFDHLVEALARYAADAASR